MKTPRILVFGGSLRADSYNHKLAVLAAEGAREAGADVTLISLRDFQLPIFDEDLEKAEGMPDAARRLKALFTENDGLIIASPEYNSTVTAVLKNAIDWVSRTTSPDEKPLSALSGKSAAILAASPGGYGGSRGLDQLRPTLENIGISVLPGQVTLPRAHEAFDEDGKLTDVQVVASIKALGASLVSKIAES